MKVFAIRYLAVNRRPAREILATDRIVKRAFGLVVCVKWRKP